MSQKVEKVHFWHIKCTSMKHILALLSWGQIWIVYELWAFTFDKMEVGHPVTTLQFQFLKNLFDILSVTLIDKLRSGQCNKSDLLSY